MSEATHPAQMPRSVLRAAAALVAISIALAALGRASGIGVARVPVAEPVVSVELSFVDQDDGSVAVYETASGRTVAVLAPGTNGFLRGVLRGFARERRAHEIGVEPPFRLTSWDDGGLSLEDPTTGRRVELQAFGPTNRDAFAQLLARAGQPS